MKKTLRLIVTIFVLSAAVFAQVKEEKRVERLSSLAKVWGAVKYFHPYPAYREIDLDKALVEAIPKVNAAKSPEEYAAAVNSMLAALDDKQTRAFVTPKQAPPANVSSGKEPLRLEGAVLYYDVLAAVRSTSQNPQKAREFTQNLLKFLPLTKAMVIDTRTPGETNEFVLYLVGEHLRQTLTAALDSKITLGTIRYRLHSGYAPQTGTTSGGYYSAMVTDTPDSFGGDNKKPFKTPPFVLIVEPNSPFSTLFSGLQSAGKAVIVSESDDLGGTLYSSELADNVQFRMRVNEIVNPDGSIGFAPDAVAPQGEAERIVENIVAGNKFVSTRPKQAVTNVAQIFQKDKTYAEMTYPSKEYRLLALFRFWNVINYFFPYKDLIGTDWDTILPKYIPKLEADIDAAEYELTVREMIAEAHDSHVGVRNANASADRLGNFLPALEIRFIENQTVIVEVFDDKLPVKAGDVILTIDGEDAGKRRDYFARFYSASTPQALMRNVHYNLLRGRKDTTAKLTVRGADGQVRSVEIPRSLTNLDPKLQAAGKRTTPVFSVLPSGFGYVDLDRLQTGEVDKMFDALKDTPAIIFDMRGYPNGTAWSIAPRLSAKNMPIAALFSRPIVDANSLTNSDYSGSPQFTFSQPIPPRAGKDFYRGKIVMLIDEYAQSQSEHTCLFFETARPDITFIGTPTAGANGDVTNLVLPGNLTVSFSGHSVRHADGRQLQRLGIQPTLKVAPTVRGITEGKDEILDAAVKFLQGSKMTTARGGGFNIVP